MSSIGLVTMGMVSKPQNIGPIINNLTIAEIEGEMKDESLILGTLEDISRLEGEVRCK